MKLIINKQNEHAINIISARETQDQIRYNIADKLICFLQVGERINSDEQIDIAISNYLKQFTEGNITSIDILNEKNQIIFATTKYTRYAGINKNINELSTEIVISFE